ncbi:glycosyltransferase family 2 protein, partial [Candidatus Desantisbacteria bacterium]|nr:glycosyltransferase family 2 protein [Candidatus Desantisbacteria bacterium]
MEQSLTKDISIVIPLFNESASLTELYQKIIEVITPLNVEYEIIFVDDGSTDDSFQVLKKIYAQNPLKIKIIQFRKNYGKSAALSVGFKMALGKIIITMDADLQDDPYEIPNFLNAIKEGYDLVSGWKYKRYDPISKTIPSKFFNYVTSITTGIEIHDFNCGFKAYKKEVTDQISVYGELHRYLPVLAYWHGYKVGEIKIKHFARKFGYSKFGIDRFLHGFFDLLTVLFLVRYTKRPLHFFGIWGFILVTIGVAINGYLGYLRLVYGSIMGKIPLLSFAVLVIIVGIQFISLGLLGEMIANITQPKDEYSIKEIVGDKIS